MNLPSYENSTGEGIVSFLPWRTSGPEYREDNSRWYCHITVNGQRIFEYGSPCGTCGIVFRKVSSSNARVSDPEAVQLLGDLNEVPTEQILERLARVLEPGEYHPVVIEGKVKLIEPGAENDYFATDVVRLFGYEPPEYKEPAGPWTPYYKFGRNCQFDRTGRRTGPHSALVTAVVMPLHDPPKLDRERIEYWKAQHRSGHKLTAFAISVVDNQSPALERFARAYKFAEHFLFTNCLLDGHHRIQAAAELGTSLRILSFLSSKFSLVQNLDDLSIILEKYIHRSRINKWKFFSRSG
jgi:hypothetical protein